MIGRRVWTEYMLSLAELFVGEGVDFVVMKLIAVCVRSMSQGT